MLKCKLCGKELLEKDALVTTNMKTHEKTILCSHCFETNAGVDYKTFQYRRESAKQGCFAVLFCLCATGYAFWEKGPLYGALGLLATVLIYFFTIKIK